MAIFVIFEDPLLLPYLEDDYDVFVGSGTIVTIKM